MQAIAVIFLACTIRHEVDFSTAYRAVRNSPGVLGVVPNYLTFTATNSDQIHSNQWHFRNTGGSPAYGTAGADVNVRKAWDLSKGSGDVNVVVMDTGIPLSYPYVLSHPDLGDSNRIIIYTDTIPDYALPRDYGNQPPTLSDASGHGTFVAGIIGAKKAGEPGLNGICPNCTILPIKVANRYGISSIESWLYGFVFSIAV